MVELLEGLKKESNSAFTKNGGKTFKTTLNANLDLFSMGGSLRTQEIDHIISLFSKAFHEDKGVAMKCLFYLRDIREGQGERRTFRVILKYLGNTYPESIKKNFKIIALFGRWDDFYAFVDTKVEKDAFVFMKNQLIEDIDAKHPSLLAKWLKSKNKRSNKTNILYKKTRQYFGMTSEEYRKTMSALRKKINIVESKMCSRNWQDIEYSKIPSMASNRYAKVFAKNDFDRYSEFLNKVKNGEVKINASAIYPFDILRSAINDPENIDTYESQWNALPNYCEDASQSIVICDTSGSMEGNPILVALSLSIYFAERNEGPFKDHYITFSNRPSLQKIVGVNLYDKYKNLDRNNWDMNTNLQSAFELILKTAVKYKIPQEKMIQKLYIISDMEFDCVTDRDVTNFQHIKTMYEKYNYEMPMIVFWNVNARNMQSPITIGDNMVYLVSGSSPSIFKNLMNTKMVNALQFMLEILNQDRYLCVEI